MRAAGGRRGQVRGPVLAGAAVALLALATGCSGGGEGDMAASSDTTAVGGGVGAVQEEGLADAPKGPAGTQSRDGAGPATGSPGANRALPQTRAVIRRGEVSLVTKEMNRARLEIDDLLGKHGGYLASEDTANDRKGRPERSVLVLRVPEPAFDEVMTELTGIGRTERADRSSEDVTSQVVDVDARVASQEAGLARLRRFLAQATTVDDMIRVESEIATRQADLESLKAQQKYLRDNTAMSTVTVHLRTPATPPPPDEEKGTGFLAGLAGGWHALHTLLVGAATVAGAVLPFALLLALVGVPAWLVMRATTRRRRENTAPPVAPEAG